MKEKLFIVIPAYNEEANIAAVVEEWMQVIDRRNEGLKPDDPNRSRLLVVDDGSKDHTLDKLRELAVRFPDLIAKTKPNAGHGPTVLFGYRYALSKKADYVFQTDSDGQTDPGEFEAFWKLRKKYDLVIGHRNKREDGFSRVIVTKTLKAVLHLTFHVSVTDANTPFRLMEASVLSENLKQIPKNATLSNVLLTVLYTKKKQRIRYLPITFRPRQGGVNSINLRRIAGIGLDSLKEFRRLNKKWSI